MLFVRTKVSQFALLHQGRYEVAGRAIAMLREMNQLSFGDCGNEREYESECPKQISITIIARLNREYLKANFGSAVK